MAKRTAAAPNAAIDLTGIDGDPLELAEELDDEPFHEIRAGVLCGTEGAGHATPKGVAEGNELRVDASEGFVPLWGQAVTLRWRFQDRSFNAFKNPVAARTAVRALFEKALREWGDAVPVKFAERSDAADFEIRMRSADECNTAGCVLAEAFFPDSGRHTITLYPQMFKQSAQEQLETFAHELGHVFGLRHWFANLKETAWASETYGSQSQYTIMNYGPDSKLTAADKRDLKKLYRLVWTGKLADVNGTPIRLFRPWHETGEIVKLRA